MLRAKGVVGKFVEFYGPGLDTVPLADRATIGNMAPEYGATCGFFPIDGETLRYLRLTGRDEDRIALVEAYAKENGMWRTPDYDPVYTDTLELDMGTVVPAISGPKRPRTTSRWMRRPRISPNTSGASARARTPAPRPRTAGKAKAARRNLSTSPATRATTSAPSSTTARAATSSMTARW